MSLADAPITKLRRPHPCPNCAGCGLVDSCRIYHVLVTEGVRKHPCTLCLGRGKLSKGELRAYLYDEFFCEEE